MFEVLYLYELYYDYEEFQCFQLYLKFVHMLFLLKMFFDEKEILVLKLISMKILLDNYIQIHIHILLILEEYIIYN